MTIGDRIKNLRISKGLTQDELANHAKTTKQTIHKYETGIIQNIPASKIKLLADKLNTTPSYLMGWDDVSVPTPNNVQSDFAITNTEKELVTAYREHPELQPAINKMLDITSCTKTNSIADDIMRTLKQIPIQTHTNIK